MGRRLPLGHDVEQGLDDVGAEGEDVVADRVTGPQRQRLPALAPPGLTQLPQRADFGWGRNGFPLSSVEGTIHR